MSAEQPSVLVSRDAGVVTVTLNRPHKKNAIDGVTWGLLQQTFDEVERSRDDRVLVITGAGGDFCSGADLTSLSDDDLDVVVGEFADRQNRRPAYATPGALDAVAHLHALPLGVLFARPGLAHQMMHVGELDLIKQLAAASA